METDYFNIIVPSAFVTLILVINTTCVCCFIRCTYMIISRKIPNQISTKTSNYRAGFGQQMQQEDQIDGVTSDIEDRVEITKNELEEDPYAEINEVEEHWRSNIVSRVENDNTGIGSATKSKTGTLILSLNFLFIRIFAKKLLIGNILT
ncbi:hypothetical protein MHBO_001200 [Bonamia ostreae]|uniref:ATP synthase F0 subunit 8 n=1 Tax=Bonamia ostreae TaxID=126728 RepID=A0ABV2AI39_9EUKA